MDAFENTNFQEILIFLMKRHNIKNFQELAQRMGLSPSTLSVYLKRLSEKKDILSVPIDFVKKLSSELNIDIETLDKSIKGDISFDIGALQGLLDKQLKTFRPLDNKYIEEIIDLISRLHQGDIYTLLTCYIPLEFSDEILLETISQALQRGVTFRYLYPTDDENSDYYKIVKRYLNIETYDCIKLKDYHNDFIENKLKEKRFGLDNSSRNRLIYKTDSDPIILSPFQKLIHITRNLLGSKDIAVFAEARIGKMNQSYSMKYWYPLPRPDALSIDRKLMEVFNDGK